MKRRAQRNRWLGLMLTIVLYLTGVCGTGAVEDIPVYTSFSCASVSDQTCQGAECEAPALLCQNSFIRLPDVMQPTERICQSRGELLERGKPERRSGRRYVEEVNDRAQESFRVLAAECHSQLTKEAAVSFCRDRIITYVHNQDGHKGYIL